MKLWFTILMSIDPELGEEDQHQKYGHNSIEAETKEDAIQWSKKKFNDNHPGYPIYWIEAYEQ